MVETIESIKIVITENSLRNPFNVFEYISKYFVGFDYK